MQRTDRSNSALRPLSIKQGILTRSDGSAQFSFGDVSVLSSVTGPVEVRLNKELVDQSTLEFNSTSLSSQSQSGPQVKAIEETLSNLFKPLILTHLYPRSLIQLTSQTTSLPTTSFSEEFSTTLPGLRDSPTLTNSTKRKRKRGGLSGMGELAARINSTTLALIDSGVQLRGMLVAVSVAFIEKEMRLDPSVFEEEQAKSCHLFTVSYGQGVGGTEGSVVGIESRGKFNQDQLSEAEDLALTATQKILAFVRKSIEAKYGVENSTPVAPQTTTTTRNEGKEIKMCVAEEGDDMSDDDDDDDQVMI